MRWHIFLGVLIFLIGIGGILFYDRYYVPVVLADSVLKVRVSDERYYLARNHTLTPDDLYLDKVPTAHVPREALKSIDQAVGRVLNVDVTDGTVLTSPMVDLDDLEPKDSEGIFALPADVIFAINGTLRRRDIVDIYVVNPSLMNRLNDELILPHRDLLFQSVKVAYVRSKDNNDVRDDEEGNQHDRLTSTGEVSYPEVILTNDQGIQLKRFIEQGYQLWIVRVAGGK